VSAPGYAETGVLQFEVQPRTQIELMTDGQLDLLPGIVMENAVMLLIKSNVPWQIKLVIELSVPCELWYRMHGHVNWQPWDEHMVISCMQIGVIPLAFDLWLPDTEAAVIGRIVIEMYSSDCFTHSELSHTSWQYYLRQARVESHSEGLSLERKDCGWMPNNHTMHG